MSSIGVGSTSQGEGREVNEDAYIIDDDVGLYAVSDGMGGHASGEVASRLAIDTLAMYVRNQASLVGQVARGETDGGQLANILSSGVRLACREIYALAKAKHEHAGMGATLTALLVAGNRAAVAHVGHSCAYLARDGSVDKLTSDHTLAADLKRKRIPLAADGEAKYRNVLTRVLGAQEAVDADTLVIQIETGDRFLVCTDGVTSGLPKPGPLETWLAGDDLDTAPDRVLGGAQALGSGRNMTALVIDVEAPPADGASPKTTDRSSKLKALGSIDLCRGLTVAQKLKVLASCREQTYGPGEVVVAQGDLLGETLIVVAGQLDLAGTTAEAGTCLASDVLLGGRPARVAITAVNEVTLLGLDRDTFLTLAEARPRLGVKMLDSVGRTLRTRAAAEAGKAIPPDHLP